jgi:hypothetical protein
MAVLRVLIRKLSEQGAHTIKLNHFASYRYGSNGYVKAMTEFVPVGITSCSREQIGDFGGTHERGLPPP